MAAREFTLESVKQFIVSSGGKVKNHELVTHFKSFLNDQSRKDEMREKFKNYVNELATIKLDEQGDKLLVLKKKYRPDSGGSNSDWDKSRASSEPPGAQEPYKMSYDKPDGNVPSRVRSDGNLSASDLRLSASTLSSASLASTMSLSSLSSVTPEEDGNVSVVSVRERAKHLNRMESESEIQKTTVSPLGATRKKDLKKFKEKDDGYESSSSGYIALEPLEKEWIVTCSAADYHPMHQLLAKNPHLAKVKDFSGGYTALHWACKHGRPEVVKLLMGKPGVNVNQRTNGGYTPLHIAAIHGHEEIIELLVQGFKADPNIRDYSGKKAKQYLRNSASSRAQRKWFLLHKSWSVPYDKSELLASSRLSSKIAYDKADSNQFMRNTSGRRSNRSSAIKSLIQASSSAMKKTVIRSSWGSTEDLNGGGVTPRSSPSVSPRNSAEPSPISNRKGSFSKDKEMMPPPSGPYRAKNRRQMPTSVSKESLMSEDKKLSVAKQVPRSESEPNLGEATQPSRSTMI